MEGGWDSSWGQTLRVVVRSNRVKRINTISFNNSISS